MRSSRLLRVSFLALAAITAPAIAAHAQSAAEAATRRDLLEQAQRASESGNHAQAVELAERAGRIAMTPSVRHFLAVEQRALGRFAEALGNADLCLSSAQRDTSTPMRDQVLTECRQLEQQLQPLVAHVTVNVPSPAPQGLVVHVGDMVLGDALYGAPYVVTPGNVVIDATAPGHAAFHRVVALTAGGNESVTLALPATESSGSPAPATASAAPASSAAPSNAVATSNAPAGQEEEAHGRSPAPFAVMGLGVLAGAASALVWFLMGAPAVADLNNQCGSALICASVNRTHDDLNTANTASLTSEILVGAAGVLVVGGALWALLGGGGGGEHHAAHDARRVHIGFVPNAGGASLVVGGAL